MTNPLDLNCRLLCASASAYLINPHTSESGQKDPSTGSKPAAQDQYNAVGYTELPWVISDGIDAALVGRTETEVIIAFRGTLAPKLDFDNILDWFNDLLAKPVHNESLTGKVHEGFLRSLLATASQIKQALDNINAPTLPLYITGHSKGGGIAPIAAMYFKNHFDIEATNVVTFAGPKPGDKAFSQEYDTTFEDSTRFENYLDIVPIMPPSRGFSETLAILLLPINKEVAILIADEALWNYKPVGTLQYIDKHSNVMGDHRGLIEKRVEEILSKFILHLHLIEEAHFSDCCCGYMNGVCKGNVCKG